MRTYVVRIVEEYFATVTLDDDDDASETITDLYNEDQITDMEFSSGHVADIQEMG